MTPRTPMTTRTPMSTRKPMIPRTPLTPRTPMIYIEMPMTKRMHLYTCSYRFPTSNVLTDKTYHPPNNEKNTTDQLYHPYHINPSTNDPVSYVRIRVQSVALDRNVHRLCEMKSRRSDAHSLRVPQGFLAASISPPWLDAAPNIDRIN